MRAVFGGRFLILAAIIIICSLAFGGVLHDVIQHEHSHTSTTQIQHGALRHEEKYLLLLALFFVSVIPAVSLLFASLARIAIARVEPEQIGSLEYALQRGILAHRKFR